MPQLTEEQKREIVLIAAVGCDRETAARYVGCTTAEILDALRQDESFVHDLVQAEAQAELAHMRNIQQAAKEDKHWRASVWWLERRAPDRYGRRDARAITPAQLHNFLASLAAAIADEVTNQHDRDRLQVRLQGIADRLSEVLVIATHPADPAIKTSMVEKHSGGEADGEEESDIDEV